MRNPSRMRTIKYAQSGRISNLARSLLVRAKLLTPQTTEPSTFLPLSLFHVSGSRAWQEWTT